jgi:hypothetical protein
MEQYTTNGQIITDLTTTTEGNALIMRKGRTSLLSAKVMLFALLKVENRSTRHYGIKDLQYYRRLLSDTTVDYTNGLVAEIDVADLKKLLKKEKSGSFYAALKELFSIDPHEEKSLRNSWAVMLPNKESGVLGYAEVVSACHYDVANGKLFMKFSDEEFIRSQIWQIKSEYTELPFLHMINIKSIHTYRLYEIIYSEMTKVDMALGDNALQATKEYSFRFSIGELQLMLGIIDVTSDKDGKKSIISKNPDYNTIASDINTRQRENMGEYRSFRRYSLDVATTEINETDTSAFTIDYDVEREEGSRKVSHVIFFVTKKGAEKNITADIRTKQNNEADFIVSLARELSGFSLKFDDLTRIAKASNYDKELVVAASVMYNKMQVTEDFTSWFIDMRK